MTASRVVWRRRIGLAALGVWVPSTTVLIGLLMVDHVAPLPPLGDPDALMSGLSDRFGPPEARVVHLIADGCSCTGGLLRHLAARGARSDRSEHVLFVGEPPEGGTALAGLGYALGRIEVEQLRRQLALDGAPVLVVQDGLGTLAYAGGYFDSPAAVRPRDVGILDAVDRGERPARLPIFGCAVNPALARARDPLGLRQRLDTLERTLRNWMGVD